MHASTKIRRFPVRLVRSSTQNLLFQCTHRCTHLQLCHIFQCSQCIHLQTCYVFLYFSGAFGSCTRTQEHAASHALVQNKIQKIHLNVTDTEINFGDPPENDRYRKYCNSRSPPKRLQIQKSIRKKLHQELQIRKLISKTQISVSAFFSYPKNQRFCFCNWKIIL